MLNKLYLPLSIPIKVGVGAQKVPREYTPSRSAFCTPTYTILSAPQPTQYFLNPKTNSIKL